MILVWYVFSKSACGPGIYFLRVSVATPNHRQTQPLPNPTIAKPNHCQTQPPPNPTTAKPNYCQTQPPTNPTTDKSNHCQTQPLSNPNHCQTQQLPNPTIAKPNQCLTQPPPNPTTAKPNCACCPITRAMNGPGNPGHIDEPHGSPTTIFLHKLGLVEKYTCAKLDLNNLLRGVGVGGGGLFRNRLYRIHVEPLLYYSTCLPLMKHEMLPN